MFTIWNTTIFNGVIGGSGYSLTKRGTGTMVFSNGANNFGGAGRRLAVEAGTVGLGNNNAVGASGTALVLNGGSVAAWNAARTIGNTLVISNNPGSWAAGPDVLGQREQPGRQPRAEREQHGADKLCGTTEPCREQPGRR
ncbi:MAG: hypothetical protein U1F98_09580 [Verrucomicrobiota bacterium]